MPAWLNRHHYASTGRDTVDGALFSCSRFRAEDVKWSLTFG